jgi:hypothetical protein
MYVIRYNYTITNTEKELKNRMLISKKEVYKNDIVSNKILKHMGYSAYKLWNIGNYERKNYKELGTESVS